MKTDNNFKTVVAICAAPLLIFCSAVISGFYGLAIFVESTFLVVFALFFYLYTIKSKFAIFDYMGPEGGRDEESAAQSLADAFLKSERRFVMNTIYLGVFASGIFAYTGIGNVYIPLFYAALAAIHLYVTGRRIRNGKFGTEPDELLELMSYLRERDKKGLPPPNRTGLGAEAHSVVGDDQVVSGSAARG